MAITLAPIRLHDQQDMEVHVSGPDGANRLYIHTGMADVDIPGGEPHPMWTQEIISFTLGEEFSEESQILKMTSTAALAGIRNEGVASFAGWRVYACAPEYDEEEKKVRMNILVGSRDSEGLLEQVSYQINVLAKI